MSADKRARLRQWLESGAARLEPLTFPQRELWETSPVAAADAAHHICALIPVRGAISARDSEAAVQRVVARQEVLRLSFLPGKNGPVQMIRATGEANFHFRELTAAQAKPEALEEIAGAIFREPFDLLQGPLHRVTMLRRAPDDHVMVLAIHHAIADGWTLGVFIQDLCAAYVQGLIGGREPLPPVPLSHSAWGAAERARWPAAEVEKRAAFWKKELAGTTRLWNAADATGAPERRVLTLPAELGRAVREVARRSGATLFSALLAGFQIAFAKWTGGADLVVGTPVANRGKTAVRETMGYFSGIVPLRGRVAADSPFSDTVRATHQATIEGFAHALPFAELVRALGEPVTAGRNPVFEVRFALQNHPIPDVDLPGLSARLKMRSTGTPRFHLACEITEQGDALEVTWMFRPTTFSADDLHELHRLFSDVLESAATLTTTAA